MRTRLLLLPLLLALLAACGGGGASDPVPTSEVASGPVLAHLTPTSALVAWRTHAPRAARLEVGPAGGPVEVRSAPPALEHRFALEALASGETYRWQAWSGDEPLGDEHVFTCPSAAPGAAVSFAVMGDTGTGEAQARAVFAGVGALAPDLALLCGDCAYGSGTPEQVNANFVAPLAALRAETPLYAVLGNHDVITRGGQPMLDALFPVPGSTSGSERYQAFTRGGCRFVGLDSNLPLRPGSAQGDWLARELAANRDAWTFLFLHHTTYSASNHGSSQALQAALVPLLDAHAVDLVFCGHDHDYERTWPLRAGAAVGTDAEPDYVNPGGTVFVVSGGGASLYGSGTAWFTAYSESVPHFVIVDVEANRLALRAIDTDGRVIDRMTITKGR